VAALIPIRHAIHFNRCPAGVRCCCGTEIPSRAAGERRYRLPSAIQPLRTDPNIKRRGAQSGGGCHRDRSHGSINIAGERRQESLGKASIPLRADAALESPKGKVVPCNRRGTRNRVVGLTGIPWICGTEPKSVAFH